MDSTQDVEEIDTYFDAQGKALDGPEGAAKMRRTVIERGTGRVLREEYYQAG